MTARSVDRQYPGLGLGASVPTRTEPCIAQQPWCVTHEYSNVLSGTLKVRSNVSPGWRKTNPLSNCPPRAVTVCVVVAAGGLGIGTRALRAHLASSVDWGRAMQLDVERLEVSARSQ